MKTFKEFSQEIVDHKFNSIGHWTLYPWKPLWPCSA